MSDRQAFKDQAWSVIGLAEEIAGSREDQDPMVRELALLNGLLAIALVGTVANPVVGPFGSIVSLRAALEPETVKAF